MSPALYLIDTSGLFRILQDKLRQAWEQAEARYDAAEWFPGA